VKPYYEDEWVQIFHGEALSVLETLPTASVAAFVADPPYSSGGLMRNDRQASPDEKYRGWTQVPGGGSRAPTSDTGTFSGDGRDQRSYAYWCALWLAQASRIAVAGAQLFQFTDWRQLPSTTDGVQAGGWIWRGVLVWDKGVGRPMRGRFRNHLEYVVWCSNGPMPEAEDIYPSTLLRHTPPSTDRVHLTQKPLSLVSELLTVAPTGAVLDPFMGSGTTLRAAKDAGRKVIGIEIEERYCEIAAERCRQEILDLGGVA
jgi:site-specific DNA-methyltransferase (adenine-specific)